MKRNDPCPCGSGRKFKRCCKRSIDQIVTLRLSEAMARLDLKAKEGGADAEVWARMSKAEKWKMLRRFR